MHLCVGVLASLVKVGSISVAGWIVDEISSLEMNRKVLGFFLFVCLGFFNFYVTMTMLVLQKKEFCVPAHMYVREAMGYNSFALFSQLHAGKNDLIVGLELIFVMILHN